MFSISQGKFSVAESSPETTVSNSHNNASIYNENPAHGSISGSFSASKYAI